MSLQTPATRPSSSRVLIVLSIVLLVLGVTGIVLYAVGAPDNLADASALGALRAGLIILSAVAVGFGLTLGLMAITRRRRLRAGDRPAR
jgi:hypothetical protein